MIKSIHSRKFDGEIMKTKVTSMKTLLTRVIIALALLVLSTLNPQLSTAFAQGTAFTYQGRLNSGTNPASGSYDLTFTLYNASSGGIGLFGPLTNSAVAVTNGLFTTTLDFGSNAFGGAPWWLQIGVRTNGGASFATLTPRQQVTPTPYAIYSSGAGAATTATTATTANGVSAGSVTGVGIASGQVVKSLNGLADAVTLAAGANVTITPSGNTLTVASTGGGGSSWSLTGNAGTTPGTDFLGTSDNEPLELWVNGGRALRLEPGNSGSPNVIGGYGSSADSSVGGGTIAGGIQNTVSNSYPTVSGGAYNHAIASGSVVGGGYNSTASGVFATISGGAQNNAIGAGSFVGGGGFDGTTFAGNTAAFPAATAVGGLGNTAVGNYSTVVGGYSNIVNGFACFAGGGQYNNATLPWSFAGGGLDNYAGGYYAVVVGGQGNQATGTGSFVGGGGYDGFSSGANMAGGAAATVPGGWGNSAGGLYSFAAGHQAQAQNQGAFVWADSQNGAFASTANDQFSVRAQGGVRFITGPAGVSINGQPVLTGSSSGTPPSGWSLTGNTNTDPSVNYLGTADGAGLELRVDNLRGMRLDFVGAQVGVAEIINSINVNGGFWGNTIGSGFDYLTTVVGGTIAGGGYETTATTFPNYVTGNFGTVGGGYGNDAGSDATVPGGYNNAATGDGSFAAGVNATAKDNNSFIWGDGTRDGVSQGADTFTVLATGGAYFYTTTGNLNVEVDPTGDVDFGTTPRQMLNLWGSLYGIGVQSSTLYQRTAAGGGFAWYAGGVHNDAQDNPGGGTTVMTLDGSGDLNVTANASVCSLTIRGGCDLAEPFQFSGADKEIPQGAVVVIDEENPGHLKLSDQPYDSRVAGVVSGANGINPGIQMHQQGLLEGGKNVALTGRVYVQADTSNGPIKPGDLLTTSATPGHAMKVTDHPRASGAILGKAMTGLSEGKGMVLVLVTLQ